MNPSPISTPVLAGHTPDALSGHLVMTQLFLFGAEVSPKKKKNQLGRKQLANFFFTQCKDRDSDKDLIVYYLWLLEVPFVSLRVPLIS